MRIEAATPAGRSTGAADPSGARIARVLHDVEQAAAENRQRPRLARGEEPRAGHLPVPRRRQLHPQQVPHFAQAQEVPVHCQERSAVRADVLLAHLAADLQRVGPFGPLAPDHLATRRLHAGQRRVGLVPAVEPVQVTVPVDGRAEVQSEIPRRPHHAVREVGTYLHERAARPVAGRDEDLVVEHDGTGGVDRLVGAAPPGKREIHAAVRRVDAHEAASRRIRLAAGEDEHPPPAVDDSRHRRGIAGAPRLPGPPRLLARGAVDGDDGGAAGSAHVDDEEAAFDQRRGRGAEEVLSHAVLRPEVPLPDEPAGVERQTVEPPLGAQREHAPPVDDRAGPGTVVVAVAVLKPRREAELPVPGTGLRVQTLHDFFVREAMREDETAVRNGWRRVS